MRQDRVGSTPGASFILSGQAGFACRNLPRTAGWPLIIGSSSEPDQGGKFMAEAALFMGWGMPARGREEAGIDVFNEAMVYWDGLKQEGKLEAIEVALLTPHGGLGGFALLRGTAQQIDSMRRSEEFK